MVKKGINYGSVWGKLLRVNLTSGSLNSEEIPKQSLKDYVGGRGLGVKLLFDEVKPNIDPLGKNNKVIIATGPLTGTPMPTGCRYEVVTESPLTGTITGANAGGYFGPMLKRTGLDAIIIEGRAKSPVYLSIVNDKINLQDAAEIWGWDTHKTTDWIKDQVGKKQATVACIGPAGENLVLFASIINDKHRAAGRGGCGAVLGSKNLKAVSVFATKKISIKDLSKFKEMNKKILKKIKTTKVTSVNLPQYGTSKILDRVNDYHVLGTRNFQQNHFEYASKINAERMNKDLLIKTGTCWGCPIACKRVTQVGKKVGEGPEFETIWAFGAQCGVKNLKAITKVNYICNELGLDTISTGNTIGCAMELSEKKLIKETIEFGDPKIIQTLTRNIAYRKGIGDKLAEGSFRFAKSEGHPELSMSVKKLELPAYEPRGSQAQGLGYATSTRGACHVRAFVVTSDMVAGPQKTDHETINRKTKLLIKIQNKMAMIDSMGVCMFSSYACEFGDYRKYLKYACGLNIRSDDEFLKTGERIWTLERMFNNKAGLTKKDDTLPTRFKTEPVLDSLDNEHVWPEKELINDYYKERQWTSSGIPTKNKLIELGLKN
jgi:aldehyde:ferredoxin oxidoreductase